MIIIFERPTEVIHIFVTNGTLWLKPSVYITLGEWRVPVTFICLMTINNKAAHIQGFRQECLRGGFQKEGGLGVLLRENFFLRVLNLSA